MLLAKLLVAFMALAQFGFLILEMFFWAFVAEKLADMKPPLIEQTEALGANQGLYNGFLAAGLLWSLFAEAPLGRQLALFFLTCVLIAAAYGAYTISVRLLFIQGLPALFALTALLMFWPEADGAK